MSKGKKVKINFRSSAGSPQADEVKTMSSEEQTEQHNLDSGQTADSHATGSDNENLAGNSPESKLAEDRLQEFLARDVDFSETEPAVTGQADSSEQSGLEKLQEELRAANDRYLRAIADLENFRKHSLKERSDLLKYQGEKVIVDLLEVIDNFELALQHKEADESSLRTGLELIHKQMLDVLERWGVKAEATMGQPFDPNKHNAINKVPSTEVAPGSIVAELKKPYYYKDKLLRVGQVVVAEAPDSELKTE